MSSGEHSFPVTGIYKITNTVNGKFYIGSSRDIRQREYTHRSLLRRNLHDNSYLQHSFNKYGEDAFRWGVLEQCPKSELLIREQYYLDLLNPTERKIGYNCSRLASGGTSTPETKEKFRATLKAKYAAGYVNHFKGKRHSEETKRKIGAYKKGKTVDELYGPEKAMEICRRNSRPGSKNPMFGKSRFGTANPMFGTKRAWLFNPVTEELLSLTNPTEDQIAYYLNAGWKRGRKKGGTSAAAKRVLQIDLTGNIVAEYRTVTDAARSLGISLTGISSQLHGNRKTAGGYLWRFAV